jgi:hypothetical protein
MDEYYQTMSNVTSKTINIKIPALSLTMQNADGSFIAEMILKDFHQNQVMYMDRGQQVNVSCKKFFILDKINTEDKESNLSNFVNKQFKNDEKL